MNKINLGRALQLVAIALAICSPLPCIWLTHKDWYWMKLDQQDLIYHDVAMHEFLILIAVWLLVAMVLYFAGRKLNRRNTASNNIANHP